MLLPALILILDVAKPRAADQPSFDCAKASGAIAKLICADPELAGLDRYMAARYQAAQAQSPDPAAQQHQEKWLARRDACAMAPEARACVADSYRQRITELKIGAGQVPAGQTRNCDTRNASVP